VSVDLVIIGAGGFAQEVAWVALQQRDRWHVRGFLGDRETSAFLALPLLGPVESYKAQPDAKFVIARGAPRSRHAICTLMFDITDDRFATLIDPSVRCHASVSFGSGSIICAGVVATVDILVGRHTIVNLNSTIGHQSRIGDFCTIAPLAAVSGNVTLEDGVEIGTGAVIRQGLRIGRGAMVGMGAVVTRDVGENECVVGNPARRLKMLPPFESGR